MEVEGSGSTPVEGQDYTLTCQVSGHHSLLASLRYQWLNNSIVMFAHTTTSVSFRQVDRYDSALYTCRVTISSPLLNSDITRQGSARLQVTGMADG